LKRATIGVSKDATINKRDNMIRISLLTAALLLAALAVACGDDEDDGAQVATPEASEVLQLRGFDITAENFRNAVSTLLVDNVPEFCPSIDGLSPAQVIAELDAYLAEEGSLSVPLPQATPVNRQESDSEDELRAAQIALDECAAAGGGA
jgi:hypothetical protein